MVERVKEEIEEIVKGNENRNKDGGGRKKEESDSDDPCKVLSRER